MKLSDIIEQADPEKLKKAMAQQVKAVKRNEKWREKFYKGRKDKKDVHPRLVPTSKFNKGKKEDK